MIKIKNTNFKKGSKVICINLNNDGKNYAGEIMFIDMQSGMCASNGIVIALDNGMVIEVNDEDLFKIKVLSEEPEFSAGTIITFNGNIGVYKEHTDNDRIILSFVLFSDNTHSKTFTISVSDKIKIASDLDIQFFRKRLTQKGFEWNADDKKVDVLDNNIEFMFFNTYLKKMSVGKVSNLSKKKHLLINAVDGLEYNECQPLLSPYLDEEVNKFLIRIKQ